MRVDIKRGETASQISHLLALFECYTLCTRYLQDFPRTISTTGFIGIHSLSDFWTYLVIKICLKWYRRTIYLIRNFVWLRACSVRYYPRILEYNLNSETWGLVICCVCVELLSYHIIYDTNLTLAGSDWILRVRDWTVKFEALSLNSEIRGLVICCVCVLSYCHTT